MLEFDKQMSVLQRPSREDIPEDFLKRLDEVTDRQKKSFGSPFPFYYVYPLNAKAFSGLEYFAEHMIRCQSYLSFKEKEMIAVVTSSHNRCSGCLTGHTGRLRAITGDNRLAEQLGFNYNHAEGLSEKEKVLCAYAHELTAHIQEIDPELWADKMRSVGYDDHQILEAVMVCAYYNFSNRCASGLGVKTDPKAYER